MLPVADAGADQTAVEGDLVTLDGSASSDIDGDALSYRWTQTDGPVVTLDLTDPAHPSLVAPEVTRTGGTLWFQLIVSDGAIDSAPVLTAIAVSNINREPSAIDAVVATDEDAAVMFTIDAMDPDDDPLTFEVAPPAYGSVSGAGAEFTYTPAPDFHGSDPFTIVVRDPAGLSATVRVQVDVAAINDRPVAHAGPNQTVQEMATVTLDGTASLDADGDVLQHTWTQIAGPVVTLENAGAAQPHFIAPGVPAGGATVTFGLVVSDGVLESVMAQVNITISNVNHPPVAEAGPPQQVGSGALVTLNGTLSYDPDNDPLTYAWQQVSGVPVVVNNADSAAPSFIAASVGASSVLTFELTVSDGLAAAADRVEITVDPQNHAPTANAGPDQTVLPGAAVTLTGAASADPDGDALTYRWTQVAGVPVVVSGELTANPTFVAPQVPPAGDTLSFDLVVSDGALDSAADRVDIHVPGEVTAPTCSAASASPSVLWPPNHRMVNIAIVNYGALSIPATLRILSVSQDEPTNGTGDGDTAPDASFTKDVLLLRAERAGTGNGRVYRVRFKVMEQSGQWCEGTVRVAVPRSASAPAVEDDVHFDSLTQPPKKKKK